MKILIRSTTLEGAPISGSGEVVEGWDCLEVVEMMRHQTPFTAGRSGLEYMADVLKGIEGDSTRPLPEGPEAASAEFLTRLAKHGLIEFLPNHTAHPSIPLRLEEAIENVRHSGLTNMLDHPEVMRLITEMGYPDVAEWLADHRREYLEILLTGGARPLNKNFADKKDDSPCADK
jgi:hypothetical protein